MNKDKTIPDKEVDDFLEGKSNLSSMYSKGNDLKSPKHLDILIKKMARDAEHGQSLAQSTKKAQWLISASIAASIIIVATVFYNDIIINDDISLSPTVSNDSIEKIPGNVTSNQTNDVEVIVQAEEVSEKTPRSNDSEVKVSGVNDKKEINVSQSAQKDESSEFELPVELRELLRNTNTKVKDDLPPPKILEGWTREQWQDQVKVLQKSGNTKLADKFIKEYQKYFPGKSLF